MTRQSITTKQSRRRWRHHVTHVVSNPNNSKRRRWRRSRSASSLQQLAYGKPALASPPPHLWLQEQLTGMLPYSSPSRSRSNISPGASRRRAPKLLPISSSAARRWPVKFQGLIINLSHCVPARDRSSSTSTKFLLRCFVAASRIGMEGSSETSPLGEPIIAKFVPTLSAVESVNSVQNQDFSDATSFAEINSPMLLIDDASTPKKKQACSQEVDFTTGCPC